MVSIRFIKGIGLGLISTCLWGCSYPLSRWLFGTDETSHLEPLNFTAIRFMIAILFFLPMFFKKENLHQGIQLLKEYGCKLWILSVVGVIGEGVLIFIALKYTTTARGSLLANFSPVLTLLLSFAIGREVLNKSKILGIVLGVAGLLFAFHAEGNDIFLAGKTTYLGDLLAFCSGLSWAYYTVFGESASVKYGGMLTSAMLFILAGLTVVICALCKNHGIAFNLTWNEWLGVIYLGGASYALGNGLWYKALTYVTPGELGSLGFISAALAILLSVVCFHERLTLQFCFAIVLEVLGTMLILKTPSGKASVIDIKTE